MAHTREASYPGVDVHKTITPMWGRNLPKESIFIDMIRLPVVRFFFLFNYLIFYLFMISANLFSYYFGRFQSF